MDLKQKMLSGEKICGTMVRVLRNPAICYLAKNAGLDYIMFDCEHSNYNMETLHDLYQVGNALGLGMLTRVPVLTKDYISRALDQGATGIMVPMTETPEQAKEIVKWGKYEPVGERGFGGISQFDYKGGKTPELTKGANEKVILIAQIETKLGVENVDAIAATEGIDALLIGPNDLSISLGVPGDLMNPIELEAIAKVAAAAKKYGKGFGLHAGIPMFEKFKDDVTIAMHSTDTDLLISGLKDVNAKLRAL